VYALDQTCLENPTVIEVTGVFLGAKSDSSDSLQEIVSPACSLVK
jgi:hypothetical protein